MKKEYLLTVDERGRIVIPKEVREKLNITGKVKLVVEDGKVQILPYVKKSFRGLFKVNVRLKDVDEVLKEASEERSRKWSEGIPEIESNQAGSPQNPHAFFPPSFRTP